MLHKFSAKILCLMATDDAYAECTQAFAEQALVLRVKEGDDGALVLVQSDGSTSVLVNPLLGPTVIADFEGTGQTLIARLTQIWKDALQPEPMVVDVSTSPDGLAGIQTGLMSIQSGLVTDAMRRNVDLLSQVAVLRARAESLNTVVNGLKDILVRTQGGAHRLLYEGKPWGNPIEVRPGQRVRQRLPIAVMPSLIGAVSATVVCEDNFDLKVSLYSVERDETLADMSVRQSSGQHLIFLPVREDLNPNTRFVEIIFENTGDVAFSVAGAFQESPEEGVRIEGGEPSDGAVRSLLLDIWTSGPAKSETYDLASPRFLVAAQGWRQGTTRRTPGFSHRDWTSPRGLDGLMIHPLPNTAAIVCCPTIARGGPFTGVRAGFFLPEESTSAVKARLILTRIRPTFETKEAALAFANADSQFGPQEIARGDWVTVTPGTERSGTVMAPEALTEGFVNIAVIAFDQEVAFGQFQASNLELIME